MALENDVFQAVAHPARRAILVLLKGGERPASALAEPFGITFSAVSQHLKVLKEADLVTEKRTGRQRIYRLRSKPLKEISDWVEDFQEHWSARLDALEEHLDKKYKPRDPK